MDYFIPFIYLPPFTLRVVQLAQPSRSVVPSLLDTSYDYFDYEPYPYSPLHTHLSRTLIPKTIKSSRSRTNNKTNTTVGENSALENNKKKSKAKKTPTDAPKSRLGRYKQNERTSTPSERFLLGNEF